MTSGQSGREQVPSVTGNLEQMIVWVEDQWVCEWMS